MAEPGSPEAKEKLRGELGAPPVVVPKIPDLADKIQTTLDSYKNKTGIFQEGGDFYDVSAFEFAQKLRAIASQGKPSKRKIALIEAFEQVARDEETPGIFEQIATHTVDQFFYGPTAAMNETIQGGLDVMESAAKGYVKMQGNMFPYNLLKKAGIDVSSDGVRYLEMPKVRQPTTTGGEITKGLTQAGLSYAVGDKIVKPVKLLNKLLPQLKTTINTPGMKGVINTAVGEAATLQGKDRFARFLNETFGVDGNQVVMYLADSKDEGEFESRLKSGLDGVLSAVGLGALIPVLVPIGKAFYKAGYFFSKVKDPKGAEQEIDNAMSFLEKVEKLYPQRIVKTKQSDDPLVAIKKTKEETVEEATEDQASPTEPVLDQAEVAQATDKTDVSPVLKKIDKSDDGYILVGPKGKEEKFEKVNGKILAWKLFRQYEDGTISSLYSNKKLKYEEGKWYEAESHPDKTKGGRKYRPMFHATASNRLPHLEKSKKEPIVPRGNQKGRVYLQVELDGAGIRRVSEAQGGDWYIGKRMKVLSPDEIEARKTGKVLEQPDEVVVAQGKKGEPLQKPAPLQPSQISIDDLDIYKNEQNIPLDSTLADFNIDRLDAEQSVLEIVQKGAEAIKEKLPTSKSYGPSGKTRKIEETDEWGRKTERYVTEGDNVIPFEEVREAADGARAQMKRMGVSMERFIAGTKATTEELPHIVLMTRDYVIDMATKVRNEARAIDELSKTGGEISNERLVRYHRSMVRFMNTLAEVKGIKRDIARTLSAMNIDAVSGTEKDKLLNAILADAGHTDIMTQMFETGQSAEQRGRGNLLKLASHMANMEYAEEVVSIGNKDTMTRVFDAINYLGVNNFLANFSTQTVNLMGSLAMTNLLTAEKFIGAAYGKIPGVGGQGQITFNEATAHTFGVTQALTEMFLLDKAMFDRSALGQAKKGFVDLDSGFSSHDLSTKNTADPERFMEYPDLDIQGLAVPEAFSSKSIGQIFGVKDGNMPDFLKEVINGAGVMLGVPGRALMAGDRFFRAMNYRSAIHALAMRKATGEGLTGKALQDRYMDLLINLPKEIDDTAQMYAQVALFQEEIGRDGLEKYIRSIEKARNAPLPKTEREWLISFAQNATASFINSKIPFFRTPYNIFKQTLVQRNPAVILGRLGLDSKYREKFTSDAAFRQDVLAKLTTGSILNYLGYSLGTGVKVGNYSVKAEGASAPAPLERDIAQDQRRMQPEILIRNMSNAEAFTIPIGRADPIATFIQTGSILGNYQAYKRAHVDPYREAKPNPFNDKADEKLSQLHDRILWQLGNLFLDKAMLRGVKDVIMKTVPGASPAGTDYPGLVRDYVTDYAGGPPLGNFGRGTVRAMTNQPTMSEAKIKEVLVSKKKGDGNITDSGIPFQNLSEQKVKELGQLQRLVNQWAEEWRKVNIISAEEFKGDAKGIREGTVKIKAGAVPMLDLEGNPMGFTEKEVGLYERWLEQNLIPFSMKKVNETNTSVLIQGLDIPTTHPKRWTHIVVNGRKMPLTTEQQMTWAAMYGWLNKKSMSRYSKVVKKLKLEGSQSLTNRQRLALEASVSQLLKANKEASKMMMMSKYSNMEEKTGLLPQYNELNIKGR